MFDVRRMKSRAGRQAGKTTVISCRVFRKGVCKKTRSNIILVNKSISSNASYYQQPGNNGKLSQVPTSASSSATPLRAAPPSPTSSRARRRTGSVFSSETAMGNSPSVRTVSGEDHTHTKYTIYHLVNVSGPIMPRITECIAARQEVAPPPPPPPATETPGKPCSFGCTGVCVGPRCPGENIASSLSSTQGKN